METREGQPVSARAATLLVDEALRRGLLSRDRAAIVSRLESFARDIVPDGGNIFSAAFAGRRDAEDRPDSLRAIGDAFWRDRLSGREQRRREGSFYTPDLIIDSILDLLRKDMFPSGTSRLEEKTVCDPALGCGFFFLRLVELLRAKNVPTAKIRRWAARSLFGVDTDAHAVFIAKALLWLSLSDARKEFLPDPEHFVVGDSLLGPAFGQEGGDGLDWSRAFPAVAERGGFDVVLGNPPYEVLTNFRRHPEQKRLADALRDCGHYRDALTGQINLYRCFIERGLDLLKPGGALSFVTPLSLARDGAASAVRKRLIEREKTAAWFLYGEKERLFTGVTQSACVFKSVRGGGEAKSVAVSSNGRASRIPVPELRRYVPDLSLPGLDARGIKLWRWFYRNCAGRLCDVADARVGEVDQTVFRSCMTDENTGTVLARGAHLSAFRLDVSPTPGRERFLDEARFLERKGNAAEDCRDRAREWRVVQLGIRNMHSTPRLLAAIAPPGVYLGNSLNVYHPHPGVDRFFLAGVLNSSWLDWLFRIGSGNNNINLREMLSLPFPSDAPSELAQTVADRYRACASAAESESECELAEAKRALDRAVGECYGVPEAYAAADLDAMLL